MQREQLEQLLSSNSMLRSTFLMLYLKEDNVEAFFTLLGTELHAFGPIYLSECFPKETVLNLGIVKSWLRSLYLIAGCSKRVLMYVGHMLFLTLYMRIAMSCSRRLCRVFNKHNWSCLIVEIEKCLLTKIFPRLGLLDGAIKITWLQYYADINKLT